MKKEKMGQIFTPEKIVDKMIKLSTKIGDKKNFILEPSVGDGAFYKKLIQLNDNVIGIELDEKLAKINKKIINSDYFEYFLKNKNLNFDLIIGNPPYIDFKNINYNIKENIDKLNLKLKNRPNLYQYFLLNFLKIIRKNGEIILIIPADVFLKTSSREIVNIIKEKFSILNFEIVKENVWKNASITTAIVKLVRTKNHPNKIKYFINNKKIFFGLDKCIKIKGFLGVKVGAVPKRKCDVITKSEKGKKFIHSKTVNTKKTIKYRYTPKEWIRPLPEPPANEFEKLYVNSKTRNLKPFFSHKSNYYDGSILCLYFKKNTNIRKIEEDLNNLDWKKIFIRRNGRLILSQSILISLIYDD